MKLPLRKAGRISLAGVTLVGWFAISNHCALAALAIEEPAEQHSHCHQPQSPENDSSDQKTPCCKILRALIAKHTAVNNGNSWQPVDCLKTVDGTGGGEIGSRRICAELDTGPPVAVSFAELVLQRSLFSHAPPALA